jgi:hypothetical protein
MTRLARAHGIVAIAIVTALIAGCAGRSVGTPRSLTDADRPMMAGTWQGTFVSSTGATLPATLLVNSDGTYTIQAGPSSSQGKAEIQDGNLVFVASSVAVGRGEAGATGQRTGSAVVLDRGDTWGLVGSGRAAGGPYHFEFSKPK